MELKIIRDNEKLNNLIDFICRTDTSELESFLKFNYGIVFVLNNRTGIFSFLIGHRYRGHCNTSDLEIKLSLLNKYGYDINAPDLNYKSPAILGATINKDVAFVNALLLIGADPDIPNEKGTTALLKAIFDFQGQKELVEIIQLLLKYNAAMNIRNISGSNAIDEIKLKHDYTQRGLYKPEFDITRYIEELKQYLN